MAVPIRVADYVMQAIARAGVGHVFMLPGGGLGQGKAVRPAQPVPVGDVKGQRQNARALLECGQPVVCRRTGTAAF